MHAFCAALLIVTAAAQAPAAGTPSLVLGRVVDAGDGRPIAGAIVSLFGSAAATTPGGTPPRVMTNDQGQFVARGLRKGTLFLTAAKGGYVDALNAQRRPLGSGQPIQIGDGQRITDVEIRMWKHAVITGSVVDEAGEPVVGARVQAYQRGLVAGRSRFLPVVSSVTDDRGVYRLAGLTPGDFDVAVTSTQVSVPTAVLDALIQGAGSPATRTDLSRDFGAIGATIAPSGTAYVMRAGGQTITLASGTATPVAGTSGFSVYPTTFYPSAPVPSQAVVVRVKSGEERTGIDLRMQPARSVSVSGSIIAPAGFAANVPLRLIPAGEDLIADLDVAATMSDGSGAFTFPAVPPGNYLLRATRVPRPPVGVEDANRTNILRAGAVTLSTSVAPSSGPPAPAPIPEDATLSAEIAIAVGDADVAGISLMFRVGPRVSGRIEFDGSGDRPDPAAIANMRITLDPTDGSKLPEGLSFVTGRVGESGQFTTFGVPPGKYFVRVSGLSDWFLKGALYQGRDLADDPIELGSSDVSGVVLMFTDRPSSIAGTIRGTDGQDGAAVALAFPTESTEWIETGAAPRRMRTARANRDGTYLFPALPPGEYYLVAVREDLLDDWRDPSFLQAISVAAQRVRVMEGERRTQDLKTAPVR